MSTHRIARTISTITMTTVLTAGLVAVGGSAQARQDPGPPPPSVASELKRPLERVGTQFVRGDDLTGNGVRAPLWIHQR